VFTNMGAVRKMQLFTVHLPTTKAVPLVANLPHSGMFIPEDITAQFVTEHIDSLPNTDWYLDKLYDFLPHLGITVLQANYSRYVVDLNRELKEPIAGNFWKAVIPLQTAFAKPIYIVNPSQEQLQERIEKFYIPYHNQLSALLQEKVQEFGKVYLLDLHSFFGLITDQICLGNINGKSCSEFVISSVEKMFTKFGYQVVRNKIFNGGYITRHYSQIPGVETLQIEVRYSVYLKENELDKSQPPNWYVPEFYAAKNKFLDIFAKIVHQLSSGA
jgi:N-formylglutamate deformylase